MSNLTEEEKFHSVREKWIKVYMKASELPLPRLSLIISFKWSLIYDKV